ncbi:hypothetical protein [Stenotrophomonas sp. S39]|uniref:hypothetical protein n=1 Tax=Stenotrophomonas sp. S39 TaxID=2767451 RepID=UPI001909D04C|nr:hypothetical protein [Stenotrophomonas sp. S39]
MADRLAIAAMGAAQYGAPGNRCQSDRLARDEVAVAGVAVRVHLDDAWPVRSSDVQAFNLVQSKAAGFAGGTAAVVFLSLAHVISSRGVWCSILLCRGTWRAAPLIPA